MSIQINVNISDERLLQDSKRRAAANQQALDDRTQAAKDQQAAEQAAQQATPEERPSAVPDLRLERRPSAQRRRQFEFTHFDAPVGFEQIKNETVAIFYGPTWAYTSWVKGAVISESCNIEPLGEFTASYTELLQTTYLTFQSDNIYADATTSFNIPFSFNKVQINTPFFEQKYKLLESGRWLTRVFTAVDWPLYTCATAAAGIAAGGGTNPGPGGLNQVISESAVSNNPTPFPRTETRRNLGIQNHNVVSSTKDSTFVSTLLRERVFSTNTTRRTERPGTSNFRNDPQYGFANGDFINMYQWTEKTYGYYVRYNHTTKETTSKIILLTSSLERFNSENQVLYNPNQFSAFIGFVSVSTREAFIQNMFSGDPRKEIFSAVGSTAAALNPEYNFVSYNIKTGYGYFVSTNDNKPDTTFYTYGVKLMPNLRYNDVLLVLSASRAKFKRAATVQTIFSVESFSALSINLLRYVLLEEVSDILAKPTSRHVAPVATR